MKPIYHFLLFFLFVMHSQSMDELFGLEGQKDAALGGENRLNVAPPDDPNVQAVVEDEEGGEHLLIPLEDKVPVDIFLQSIPIMESARVLAGFHLKTVASSTVRFFNYLNPLAGPVVKTVSSSALDMCVNLLPEDGVLNFPEIQFNQIYELLKDIPDRKTFFSLPLVKRAFFYETKGYEGYWIIKDLTFGDRLPDLRYELNEYVTPTLWLERYFQVPSPMYLKKGIAPFKDSSGNTCLFYELDAGLEGMRFEVFRKKKQEYEEKVSAWILQQQTKE